MQSTSTAGTLSRNTTTTTGAHQLTSLQEDEPNTGIKRTLSRMSAWTDATGWFPEDDGPVVPQIPPQFLNRSPSVASDPGQVSPIRRVSRKMSTRKSIRRMTRGGRSVRSVSPTLPPYHPSPAINQYQSSAVNNPYQPSPINSPTVKPYEKLATPVTLTANKPWANDSPVPQSPYKAYPGNNVASIIIESPYSDFQRTNKGSFLGQHQRFNSLPTASLLPSPAVAPFMSERENLYRRSSAPDADSPADVPASAISITRYAPHINDRTQSIYKHALNIHDRSPDALERTATLHNRAQDMYKQSLNFPRNLGHSHNQSIASQGGANNLTFRSERSQRSHRSQRRETFDQARSIYEETHSEPTSPQSFYSPTHSPATQFPGRSDPNLPGQLLSPHRSLNMQSMHFVTQNFGSPTPNSMNYAQNESPVVATAAAMGMTVGTPVVKDYTFPEEEEDNYRQTYRSSNMQHANNPYGMSDSQHYPDEHNQVHSPPPYGLGYTNSQYNAPPRPDRPPSPGILSPGGRTDRSVPYSPPMSEYNNKWPATTFSAIQEEDNFHGDYSEKFNYDQKIDPYYPEDEERRVTDAPFWKRGFLESTRARAFFWLGIGVFVIIIIVIAVSVAVVRKTAAAAPDLGYSNVTVSGFPPMPVGNFAVSKLSTSYRSSCVTQGSAWSCLAPSTSSSDTNSYLNSFNFEISNSSSSSVNKRSLGTHGGSIAGMAASIISLVKRGTTASPPQPSDSELTFIGTTTDNSTSSPVAGTAAPFVLTMSGATNTSSLATRGIAANGTAGSSAPPANLLPSTPFVNQQLRLYDAGLPTEHYGFYNYFDRTMWVSTVNSTDNSTSGGADAKDAKFAVVWHNTRLEIKIWTRMNSALTAGSNVAAANGTAAFPYPVTITTDRHGQISQGDVYYYGIADGKYTTGQTLGSMNENFGADGSEVVSLDGTLVGGTGGCVCQWTNF
jgi:hypothetical protein